MLGNKQESAQPEAYVMELLRSEKLDRTLTRVKRELTKGPVPLRGSDEWKQFFDVESNRFQNERIDTERKVLAASRLAALAIEAIQQYTE